MEVKYMGFGVLESGPDIDVTGTSYVGLIEASYLELADIFGEDVGESGDGKVTAEYNVRFADGTVATIYNWKTDADPLFEKNWHVGGKNNEALWNVMDALDAYRLA